MSKIRVAILDMHKGAPNQGMRNIHELIDKYTAEHEGEWEKKVFDVRGKQEIPDTSYDIYISSGGPGSPIDAEGWETGYVNLIDTLLLHNKTSSNKKFILLICHSFQIICHHFELANVCLRRKESFGIFPVHLTKAAESDPCFNQLPEPFYVVDSRKWQVIDPHDAKLFKMGAKILALEKHRPHVHLQRAVMAIRFSPEMLGTQFHPEADARGMIYHLETEEKKTLVVNTYGQERYDDMLLHLNDPDKIMLTQQLIIPQFLDQAAQTISHQG